MAVGTGRRSERRKLASGLAERREQAAMEKASQRLEPVDGTKAARYLSPIWSWFNLTESDGMEEIKNEMKDIKIFNPLRMSLWDSWSVWSRK